MANVESEDTWHDLGSLRLVKCKKVLGVKVCTIKFSNGKLTINKSELDRVCKNGR